MLIYLLICGDTCVGISLLVGSGCDLVIRVLDSGLWDLGFDPHPKHGSLVKLRQCNFPQYTRLQGILPSG